MVEEKPKDRKESGKAQGVDKGPNPDSSIFIHTVESFRLQGRYEEAIGTCKKELEKVSNALLGRLLLGRCYWEKGMVTEAKNELEKVASEIEECLPVYKLLSQVYLQEKDVEKALEVLRKSIYFELAEEGASRRATPLEMDLFHKGTHLPFVTPPYFGTSSSVPSPPPLAPAPPAQERAPEKLEVEAPKEEPQKEPPAEMQTDTLAEIYSKQGHLARALSVYEEILSREPGNAAVREKCETLKNKLEKDRQALAREKVQGGLEKWLAVLAAKKSAPSP